MTGGGFILRRWWRPSLCNFRKIQAGRFQCGSIDPFLSTSRADPGHARAPRVHGAQSGSIMPPGSAQAACVRPVAFSSLAGIGRRWTVSLALTGSGSGAWPGPPGH